MNSQEYESGFEQGYKLGTLNGRQSGYLLGVAAGKQSQEKAFNRFASICCAIIVVAVVICVGIIFS